MFIFSYNCLILAIHRIAYMGIHFTFGAEKRALRAQIFRTTDL